MWAVFERGTLSVASSNVTANRSGTRSKTHQDGVTHASSTRS